MSSRDYALRLHVGLPRCASTSLQLMLASSPRCLGKPYRHPLLKSWFRQKLLFGAPPAQFTAGAEALGQALASLALPPGPLIISDELFSGLDFSHFADGRWLDAGLVLERIARLFGELEVLVVIRRQDALLKSYYHYLLGLGYNLAYQRLIERVLAPGSPLEPLISFAPWLVPAGYGLRFLPFEALIAKAAAAELEAFFGCVPPPLERANPSLAPAALWDALARNLAGSHGLGRSSSPLDTFATLEWFHRQAGPEALHALEPATEAQLRTRIVSANRRLAAHLPWDLAQWGYWLD